MSPQSPSLARAITPQRDAYNRQSHGQYRNDVEQNVRKPGHRKHAPILSSRARRTRWFPNLHPLRADSALFLPMPMSHSAVRRMSARARHDEADQCRVSNWRALSNRLPAAPGSHHKRAISSMQRSRLSISVRRATCSGCRTARAAFAFRPDGLRNSGRKIVRDIARLSPCDKLAGPRGQTVAPTAGVGYREKS
jgi:hypothetical protein